MKSEDTKAGTTRAFDRLLAKHVMRFDAGLQQEIAQLDGTELRRAYWLEQFARRVFNGDYQKAAGVMEKPYPSLGNRSPREATETDAGMLAIRCLISEMEWHARHRGLGTFLQAVEDTSMREFTLLLDALPTMWGLSAEDFEQLLGVPESWLSTWDQDAVTLDDATRERLRRLRRFYDVLQLGARPSEYPGLWRRVWGVESPIGQRSLWQAFQEDGDAALDSMENYFWLLVE